MRIRDKRGIGLNGMYSVVLLLVVVGILLGMGIYILASTQDALTTEYTITNETVVATDAGTAVAEATDCGFNSFAVTNVFNGSLGYVVQPANYTFSASQGTITNLTSDQCGPETGCRWNVTYTYRSGEDDNTASSNYCDSLGTAVTGTGDFADWIAVIVVVIAAAIVLGIVLSSFGKKPGV